MKELDKIYEVYRNTILNEKDINFAKSSAAFEKDIKQILSAWKKLTMAKNVDVDDVNKTKFYKKIITITNILDELMNDIRKVG